MTVAIASTCYEGEIILDNLDCVKIISKLLGSFLITRRKNL